MQRRETVSGFHWRLALLADANNLVENALRDFPLRGLRNFNDFITGDDSHFVAIGVESNAFAGNVVDYDGVELLGCQLLTGVLEDVFSLRGEAHDDLGLLAQRNFLENVDCRFELESERAFTFYFLRRD